MSNYKFTPQSVGAVVYSIPLYQRLFEWDEEKIIQLLNDLASTKEHQGDNKAYYVGMLTSTADNDLVDGQQRFTVMMLMGIIMREYYAKWSDFICYKQKPRLKFNARPDDEKYLNDIINRKISLQEDVTLPYENKKMKRGMLCIANYMKKHFESPEMCKAFSKYIYENITFFVSTLPSNYHLAALNKYFERMNSTGRNLEGHEILKVKLLQRLTDNKEFYTKVWNRVSDMDRTLFKVRTHINESQEDLKGRIISALQMRYDSVSIFKNNLINGIKASEEENYSGLSIEQVSKTNIAPNSSRKTSEGTRSVMNFSDFLLQCLYCFLQDKNIDCGEVTVFFNKANIVRTFDLLLNQATVEDIRQFFERILRYRILLDVYFIRILEGDGDIDYDLESPYKENSDLEILKMFEEMIYVNSAPVTYYQWFSELMRIVDIDNPITPKQLYINLKSYDDKVHPASSIDLNKMTYESIDRYWFWRLDFYIWQHRNSIFCTTDDNDPIKLSNAQQVAARYVFKRNRSIEHIAPQTPLQEDTLILSEDSRDQFGNLVMISSQQNSSLSNSIYQEKRARVEAHLEGSRGGSIESLKMLHAFTFNENWDEKAIKDHGELMLKYLQDSYN